MNRRDILFLAFGLIMFIVIVSSVSNLLKPPEAGYDDTVFEDIGGDGILNVTLDYCLKIKEENIPDGYFSTSQGDIGYYNAKNITYADMSGNQDYFIVWKTTPDKYIWDDIESVNQYMSVYLLDGTGKCFVYYKYDNQQVYGVMVSTVNENFTENEFMFDILGLDPYEFELTYTPTYSNYGGYSYDSASSYHTVVPDRYTLSRTDPGAYYDHYEYGDNYDIDNYLESEGYD